VEILRRLVELSMQLAELTARQIQEEAAAKPEQAKAEPRRADPRLIYLRLDRAIRDTIALIKRIAAGDLPKAPRSPREPAPRAAAESAAKTVLDPHQDPRRPHILRYFSEGIDITQKRRKIPLTQQDIENHVTAELIKDSQQRLQGSSVLLRICKSLDLPFYATRMSPELLRPPRPLPITSQ